MAITTNQKADFLWKKLIYGVTETNGEGALGVDGGKFGANETISSEVVTYGKDIWTKDVPTIPPFTDVPNLVQYFGSLQLTQDPTVSDGRTWLACSTFGDLNTRIRDFIPPTIDSQYLVEVYKNSDMQAANKLNMSTTNQEWVFDYVAGVLHFPNGKPSGVTGVWIKVHRYQGPKGIFGAGITMWQDEVTLGGLGSPVENGEYVISNFFTKIPQVNTYGVFINGVRLLSSHFYVGKQAGDVGSDKDLVILMDNLPYPLENDDVITSQYGYAE